jgi:hypothetical protein
MWADFLSHFSELCSQDLEMDMKEAPREEPREVPQESEEDPQTAQTPSSTTAK